MKDVEESMEKIKATYRGVIELFIEHDLEPNEALALLSELLTQIYYDAVEDPKREDFVNAVSRCYDTMFLFKAEPEGSVH